MNDRSPADILPRERTPNVLFLTPSLALGGAERWIAALVRWLPWHCTVALTFPTVCDATLHTEIQQSARVIGYRRKNRHALARAWAEADVIIAWGIGDLTPFRLPSTAPVVWVAHGTCAFTHRLAQQVAPQVQHWVGVSERTRAVLPPDCQPHMRVLQNGAELERCLPVWGRATTRAHWGVKPQQIAVGYIGRFSPEKRPCGVAEAVRHLPQNFVAVLIGDGWQAVETRRLAEQLAPGRVLFPGRCSAVGDALVALDAWVNVSPAEGFSLSLIEAWLAGIPVISTPTGAIPELQALHGELVAEVPVGAPGSHIARVITEVCRTHPTARTLRAQQLAHQEFTAQAMAQRWQTYLQASVLQHDSQNPVT